MATQKPTGIEGLIGHSTPMWLDKERKEIKEKNYPFSEILQKYDLFLERVDEYKESPHGFAYYYFQTPSDITNVLAPDQINKFLQITLAYKNQVGYHDLTGLFVTKLIQDSHNAGYNNFYLGTSAFKELHWIGAHLKRTQLTIKGDVGMHCGSRAKDSIFTITGNVGDCCGVESLGSTFSVAGNVGDRCGTHASRSTFLVVGNVGDNCGHMTWNSTFSITGTIGDECGEYVIGSTFKTPNKRTLKKMILSISPRGDVYYTKGNHERKIGLLTYTFYGIKNDIEEIIKKMNRVVSK